LVTDQTGPLAPGPLATGSVTEPRILIVLVWTALAFALGVAVRTQRAYVVALAERARRAEETREQETRARVAEERVRIARELHDVVAHHIAVINVHAGLARRAVGRDAAVVDTSLGHVQDAARTVLDELGAVLQVLRSNDALDPATAPTPGLDRLDDLLATFAAAGFVVRTRATGRRRDMNGICDLAAFRIIQESLTNASKHGTGLGAELELTYTVDALTIAVHNPVEAAPGPAVGASPRGHGLIGMRERAAACGGSLTVRRDGRTFRVDAVIPYRPTGAATSDDATGHLGTTCGGLA
jgi:signal transduction histidine kinase